MFNLSTIVDFLLLGSQQKFNIFVEKGSNIADRFRAIRRRLGLNQTAMAERLMIDRSYLSQIETGKRKPSNRLVESLLIIDPVNENVDKVHKQLAELGYPSDAGSAQKVNEEQPGYRKRGEPMRIREEYQLPREIDLQSVDQVIEYLQPWMDQAAKNPNVAPYILAQLKKALPHEDISLFNPSSKKEDS